MNAQQILDGLRNPSDFVLDCGAKSGSGSVIATVEDRKKFIASFLLPALLHAAESELMAKENGPKWDNAEWAP